MTTEKLGDLTGWWTWRSTRPGAAACLPRTPAPARWIRGYTSRVRGYASRHLQVSAPPASSRRCPVKVNLLWKPSHGARPVHQIISLIKWIRTSKWSIKISLWKPHNPTSFIISAHLPHESSHPPRIECQPRLRHVFMSWEGTTTRSYINPGLMNPKP